MSEGIVNIGDSQLRITAPDAEALQAEAKRIADLPELPLSKASFGDKAKIAAALFTTPDAASRLDIIQKVLPDAEITRIGDNAIINYKGEMQFLNKPGLSALDVADVGASIVKFLPAAKGAQAMGQFGKAAGIATAATLSGVTSAAEDLAAEAQGSEQGIVGSKVALDTVLGGGSEFVAPLIGKAFKFAKGLFSNPASIVDGKLTPDAVKALRESGLDIRQLRTALLDIVQREGPEALAASPDDIAAVLRKAEASDLGVDLTKGQATRDFGQLSREDTLRTADITSKSGRVLRDFEDQQVGQLSRASGQVQDSIATGAARTADNIDEIGDSLLTSLRSEHAAARKAVNEAYDAARELDGSFTGESVADMTKAIQASLADDIVTRELQPASFEILKRMKSLGSTLTADGVRPKSFNIKRIEVMRKQINNLINSAKNPDDKRIALKAKRAFDQWSDEAIDSAAFSGDEEALTALKKARAANTRLRSTFESTSKFDTAGKVVDNLLNKDVTGREAVNYIFGVSALGQKQGATATVKRLREILPKEQFNIVREGAWMRIMEKSLSGGRFSRPKALKAINEALTGNGSAAMRELFTPEEFARIRKFRRVIASTTTPSDATGPSGTPRKIAQMAQQLAQNLGLATAATTQNPVVALLAFTPQARQILNFRAARQAARGFELPAQVSPVITATGVAAGRELEE